MLLHSLRSIFGPPDIDSLRKSRNVLRLIEALGYEKDQQVRKQAAVALGELGDARAAEPLIASLRGQPDDICRAIHDALVKIGSPCVGPLIAGLQDAHPAVRRTAAWTLGDIGDPRAAEPLLATVRDGYHAVRANAFWSLGRIGDPRAVEPAIAALKDKEPLVRQEAARALGQFGDARAVAPLLSVLPGQPEEVWKAVRESLVKIGAPSVEPLIGTLERGEAFERSVAAWALGDIKDRRAVDPLIVALGDADRVVRQNATTELGELGDTRAVDGLIGALADCEPKVRQRAVLSLTKLGDVRARQPLIAALRDAEDSVREAARKALDTIDPNWKESDAGRGILEAQRETLGERPVFEWQGNRFTSENPDWATRIQEESDSAIVWFKAQNFVPPPSTAQNGEGFVAVWYFEMAKIAERQNIVKEAWAGFHISLRKFLALEDESHVASTCYHLGQVCGGGLARPDLAQLFFAHSAYLNRKTGNKEGLGWALVFVGKTAEDQGDIPVAIKFWRQAVAVLREVAPNEAAKVEKSIERYTNRSANEPETRPPAERETSPMETYRNQSLGLSFLYPQGWDKVLQDGGLVITSPDAPITHLAITMIAGENEDFSKTPVQHCEDFIRLQSDNFRDYLLLWRRNAPLSSGHTAIEYAFDFADSRGPFRSMAVVAVRRDSRARLFSLDVSGMRSAVQSSEALCYRIINSLSLDGGSPAPVGTEQTELAALIRAIRDSTDRKARISAIEQLSRIDDVVVPKVLLVAQLRFLRDKETETALANAADHLKGKAAAYHQATKDAPMAATVEAIKKEALAAQDNQGQEMRELAVWLRDFDAVAEMTSWMQELLATSGKHR